MKYSEGCYDEGQKEVEGEESGEGGVSYGEPSPKSLN